MTRPLRPCLDCGARFRSGGSRCAGCERERQRRRNQIRTQYGGSWSRTSRDARRREPWCHRPGCPNPHTADLTLDHETGTVECRSCNSSHRRNPR